MDTGSSFMINSVTGFLVSNYIAQDRLDEAAALLPVRLPDSPVASEYFLLKAAAELNLTRQDTMQAEKLLDLMKLPDHTNWPGGMGYYYGAISRLRGEILMQLERLDEAEADLQNALDVCENLGVRMGQWHTQLTLGKLCQARGDRKRAKATFATVRSSIEELAATISNDSLRQNFLNGALAMIPPTQPLTPLQAVKEEFGGLTRRERQVAAVVARGLTNQEIADELVVSIKTIEAHVTRILSKLGFSSRVQIAAWAVDKGLASPPQDLDSLSSES
jgi:DNA-binding CsgD family transcriptional regulator